VLDPVGVGLSPMRRQIADALLAARPTAIRGNADEILALAGGEDPGPHRGGVDAAGDTASAEEAAVRLARRTGAVLAVTGAPDRVTDGRSVVRIANGAPLMVRVTGLGCALSCLVGAFLAVAPEGPQAPLAAVAAALVTFGVAGEQAAAGAEGPGSLRTAMLDRLFDLTPAALAASARVSVRPASEAALAGPPPT
jgi:hydroxyethylthiazole kinase